MKQNVTYMIEREQLIEFLDGIVTKEQLENVATVEQLEEQNRKLMARLDVQQGQLDGLQALIGAMQVKITQMQLQVVKMEELLAVKDSEIIAAREKAEKMAQQLALELAENAEKETTPVEQEPETTPQPVPLKQPETEQTAVNETAHKEETKEKTETHTIADAIRGEESLAEKLSKHMEHETVATSINSSKIERIQTAITIADRFRFQRELFAGDAVKMAETVATLNNMKSLDEALAYIEKNFSWDMDQQVTMDFIRIVERRF